MLEHNISVDTAREFKTRSAANAVRLREWVRTRVPALDEEGAYQFAGAVAIIAGGLWAYERPSASVAQVTREQRSEHCFSGTGVRARDDDEARHDHNPLG